MHIHLLSIIFLLKREKLEFAISIINRDTLGRFSVPESKKKRCMIFLHAVRLFHIVAIRRYGVAGDCGIVIEHQVDRSDAKVCQNQYPKANRRNATA